MNPATKLSELLNRPAENEIVEFKEARNSFDLEKLGKYFSALSNEANLQNAGSAWLVFGVKDADRSVTGMRYRPSAPSLNKLKSEIANHTTGRITFAEIHEVTAANGKRVILFQIAPSPRGIPISWKGHYYGRDNDQLQPLNLQELESIRTQAQRDDWSIRICPEARLRDLSPDAITKARELYKRKNPHLAVDAAYAKIRNLKYRYMDDRSLFPEEVFKYDPYVIREALNNCIAHQDYALGGKINIVESEDDSLVFSNLGVFLPETKLRSQGKIRPAGYRLWAASKFKV